MTKTLDAAVEPTDARCTCGHFDSWHSCTFTAVKCICGCTAFTPAADDEGGQE